jgi:hypothetical protein
MQSWPNVVAVANMNKHRFVSFTTMDFAVPLAWALSRSCSSRLDRWPPVPCQKQCNQQACQICLGRKYLPQFAEVMVILITSGDDTGRMLRRHATPVRIRGMGWIRHCCWPEHFIATRSSKLEGALAW